MSRQGVSRVYAYIRMHGTDDPELWLAVRHVSEPGGLLDALLSVTFAADGGECSFDLRDRRTRTADRTERIGDRILSTTWYSFPVDDCARAMIESLTSQSNVQILLEASSDHAVRTLESSEIRNLGDIYASWLVLGGAA